MSSEIQILTLVSLKPLSRQFKTASIIQQIFSTVTFLRNTEGKEGGVHIIETIILIIILHFSKY